MAEEPADRPDEGLVQGDPSGAPFPVTPGEADPAEPAGDQDPEVEREYQEAKEEAAADEPAASAEPDYKDMAMRSQAELENYRKRAAREVAQAGQRAKTSLVRELLPVVDNLERALATANPEEDHLAEGVRLVHTELLNTLERNGVRAFDPAGEQFDPNVHEALSTRPGDNGAGVVLDVVEKGYKLGDSVIRPARVIVSA